MDIVDLDAADPRTADEMWRLTAASYAHDREGTPPPTEKSFRGRLAHTDTGERHFRRGIWEGDRLVGYHTVTVFELENKDLAFLREVVDPARRRRGLGQALVEDALRVAGKAGRTRVLGFAYEQAEDGPDRSPAATRLKLKNGFRFNLREHSRMAPVAALGEEEERELFEESVAASPGYRIRTWVGPCPEDVIESFCRLFAKLLGEMPTGELDLEDFQMTPERQRGEERGFAARGMTLVTTVALDGDGEVAAITEYMVPAGVDYANQGMTLVDPAHRGRRLGTRVKIANLRRLREEAPEVERLLTANAETNEHMNRINERLGFRSVEIDVEYLKEL
ncbi:GNAT family N-acetyltransferase [Salininema proteolyticum]|uniref:GNAT family N-acetyltransferase n=1 Tax=Salininema proteolyticum TaxID=1607685 RepID=A0ABV8U055_9ACTN